MNCPECGIPLYQLEGWDFFKGVCFNHDPPLIYNQTWCHDPTWDHRELFDVEREIIKGRVSKMLGRLAETDEENLKAVVNIIGCFQTGGCPLGLR